MPAVDSIDPHPASAELAGLPVLPESGGTSIVAQLEDGSLTSAALVAALYDRIAKLDGSDGSNSSGPELHAMIAVNAAAIEDAQRLDEERSAGRVRGPLHGVPVIVKDNVDTTGSMGTTAGSLALQGIPVAADASLVRRLRDAGAIVLGKANLSEWANIRSGHSTSGWSAVGGLARNPWALDRSAGGSSSGSAIAVAAGYAPLAVGTETDGSIICPAALCGVVGIKPTVGRVSRTGVIPISSAQDSPGPMARTVRDAAALLSVLSGSDPSDPATAAAPSGEDFVAACLAGGLQGARIGVPRTGLWGYNPAADAIAEDALRTLSAAGATIIDPADIATSKALEDSGDELTVLMYELKAGLGDYLTARGGGPSSLADVVEFNAANADREMPYFKQELFELALTKGPLSDPEYLEALARSRRMAREDGIDAILREHNLDALVAPAFPPAWKIDLVNGDSVPGGCTQASAVAGYPIVTVPAGLAGSLPVGIAIIGPAWSEATLIRLAYAYEQARGPFAVPSYRQAQIG